MILDGKKVADARNDILKNNIQTYVSKGLRKPALAIILVGDNPASQTYVKNKIKTLQYVGIEPSLYHLEAHISEQEVLALVEKLNQDINIDGYIVQLPLPKGINEDKVLEHMDVKKDVDGFHVLNQGLLFQGRKAMHAATPKGIINLLEAYHIDVKGLDVVVVGRSRIVGMPIFKLLLDLNATVTVVHSRTKDLEKHTKNADLVVAALGKAKFIKAEMVKEGAIIIDVGINKLGGKIVGDVDFENVVKKVSYITPVPKGIGPMTINALLENLFLRYQENVNCK